MKMHGLGNDFVVLDGRARAIDLSPGFIVALADRHRGIGFDQLALITEGASDAHLSFYNADGSSSSTCGNATRCIARHLMDMSGKNRLTLTTATGALEAEDAGNGLTAVNMGHPRLEWHEVPLAEEMDTLELPIEGRPTATGMGNPHCTFFVEDAEAIPLAQFGPRHECNPLFPERTNVQVVTLLAPDHLRMRVWERGVGVTQASGSSCCATAVAAARRGITGRHVRIEMDGGPLEISWRKDGVWMTGATMHVCDGVLSPEFLESVK